jgi:hypothetical protein
MIAALAKDDWSKKVPTHCFKDRINYWGDNEEYPLAPSKGYLSSALFSDIIGPASTRR